jgi:hypothetical protein
MCLDLIKSGPHKGVSLENESDEIFEFIGESGQRLFGALHRGWKGIGNIFDTLVCVFNLRSFEGRFTHYKRVHYNTKSPDISSKRISALRLSILGS